MKRSMFSNHERRQQRQVEAAERQAARDKRTPQQQINVLVERGVTSGREWDRLHKMIEEKVVDQVEVRRQERRAKFQKARA